MDTTGSTRLDVVHDGTTLVLSGDFDAQSTFEVRNALHLLLEGTEQDVVVDLTDVARVDVIALKVLAVRHPRGRPGRPPRHPARLRARRPPAAAQVAPDPSRRARARGRHRLTRGPGAGPRRCGQPHTSTRLPPGRCWPTLPDMTESSPAPTSATASGRPPKDRPWVMRTYAGHSSAAASNALYRTNLAKGQTGLSVAFDLPTQTGFDPDSPLARGEVGKVGVPVPHLGEMRRLFEDIPLTDDEHLDDDQRHRDVAARALPGRRRGAARPRRRLRRRRARRGRRPARRHDAERHHQGVPLPRDLRLPARALAATDRRRDRLHGPPDPEVEPDQHLQLPPAGGRRDARAGARLRAVHRDRRPRHGARVGPGVRGGLRARSSAGSPSSSTRACASSRRCARCAPSCSSGTS